jgi:hypothetical protein
LLLELPPLATPSVTVTVPLPVSEHPGRPGVVEVTPAGYPVSTHDEEVKVTVPV